MAAPITIQPMLAEISDKMPTVGALWFLGVLAAAIVFALYRLSKLTLLVSLPAAGFWLVGSYHEFFGDAYFKSAVISEMGVSYLRLVVFTAALPLGVAIIRVFSFLHSKRSFAAKI